MIKLRVDDMGHIYTEFEEEYQLIWMKKSEVEYGSHTLATIDYLFDNLSWSLRFGKNRSSEQKVKADG